MPNEYKKSIKQINAQQQQPTQQRQSLKALTTKAIPESFLMTYLRNLEPLNAVLTMGYHRTTYTATLTLLFFAPKKQS